VTIPTIAPGELQALISAGTTVDLIDVRNADEFAAVHAAGAINRPLAGLDPERILAERKAPAGDPLYLICDSGMRSVMAAEVFIGAGFSTVFAVAGGTAAWEAAGQTVVCAPASVLAPADTPAPLRLPALAKAPAPASVPLGQRRGVWPVVAILAAIALWIGVFMVPHKAVSTTMGAGPSGGLGHGAAIDFSQAVIAESRIKPVVVDYYAVWCQPCKVLAPDLDAVLAPKGNAIAIVRIDTDDNQTLAKSQGITGIPNVQLWKNGREVAHFTGYMSKKDISDWLELALVRH
jgi:thioredoxin